jgi:hypothetical protein
MSDGLAGMRRWALVPPASLFILSFERAGSLGAVFPQGNQSRTEEQPKSTGKNACATGYFFYFFGNFALAGLRGWIARP